MSKIICLNSCFYIALFFMYAAQMRNVVRKSHDQILLIQTSYGMLEMSFCEDTTKQRRKRTRWRRMELESRFCSLKSKGAFTLG